MYMQLAGCGSCVITQHSCPRPPVTASWPQRQARPIYVYVGVGVCVYIQAHETLCTLRFSSLISQCELGKATKHICLDKDSEVRHATKSYFFCGLLKMSRQVTS